MANYSYLSDGTKLSATDALGDGLCYQGSLVYELRYGAKRVESISFPGGRLVATDNGFEPRYFVTDHLGSTRMVLNDAGAVLERNDYYPYGTRWPDENSTISDNRYRYNGKEDQSFVNLPYTDYGARMYNGTRWLTIDPLAEKYYSISPYAYCAGNPVKFVDPDGKDTWLVNSDGDIVKTIHDKRQDAFYMVQQVEGEWQKIEGKSISFEYGTITGINKPTVNVMRENGNITQESLTLFNVNGDDNAKRLFEFMANPDVTTDVEWTHAKIGTESSGRNIVGTSHNRSSTSVGGYLFFWGGAADKPNYTLREVNHNHPNGFPLPSGADMQNAGRYMEKFSNVGLSIYVPTSGYSPYNSSGTIDGRITKLSDGGYILPDGQQVRTR